jgi:hypothetical protein
MTRKETIWRSLLPFFPATDTSILPFFPESGSEEHLLNSKDFKKEIVSN